MVVFARLVITITTLAVATSSRPLPLRDLFIAIGSSIFVAALARGQSHRPIDLVGLLLSRVIANTRVLSAKCTGNENRFKLDTNLIGGFSDLDFSDRRAGAPLHDDRAAVSTGRKANRTRRVTQSDFADEAR